MGWEKGAIGSLFYLASRKFHLSIKIYIALLLERVIKKENIIKMAEELNLSLNRKAVHVIGARYDVLSYYLESDLVIGTGRVPLEALSCERAIIAAGSKGCIGIVSEENQEEMWDLYFGDHKGKTVLIT